MPKRARVADPDGGEDSPSSGSSPEFEDYTRTAAAYDATRRTPALPALLGCLASGAAPLHEAAVFELGCGSGNYLHKVKAVVRAVTGLDRNAAMLGRCRAKCAPGETAACKVTLARGEAEALPFADDTFDAAYACQVFHHFDPTGGHAMAKRVLRELRRVVSTRARAIPTAACLPKGASTDASLVRSQLKPGGVLFLNICTPENTADGLWWSPLIPKATQQYCARCITPAWLRDAWRAIVVEGQRAARVDERADPSQILRKAPSLPELQWVTHNSELFTDPSFYLDVSGPLQKSWRDTDSTWAMACPDELASALGGAPLQISHYM